MELNVLWFILVTVLFVGFFFLEGFDYGVGILLPFLGKNDMERRAIINSIGPVWDGNEVWMITAGGAIFASFPHWYATLFSGFYLALFLMLLALILRGVAFEFRSKDENPAWRRFWDWAIFGGSLVPALLWGVALANVVKGVAINSEMQYVGSFFDLLNPYALVGGLVTLTLFIFHGALYLALKTEDVTMQKSRQMASQVGLVAMGVLLLFAVMTYTMTDLFENPAAAGVCVGAFLVLLAGYGYMKAGQIGKAFIFSGLSVALATVSLFWGMFPRVMVSSLNPEWSLTIHNASSSPYTLKIMTIVALILVPVILAYQAWTYWVFRQRISTKQHLEY